MWSQFNRRIGHARYPITMAGETSTDQEIGAPSDVFASLESQISGKRDHEAVDESDEPSRKRARNSPDPYFSGSKLFPSRSEDNSNAQLPPRVENFDYIKKELDTILQGDYPEVVKKWAKEGQKNFFQNKCNEEKDNTEAINGNIPRVDGSGGEQDRAVSKNKSLTDVPPPFQLGAPPSSLASFGLRNTQVSTTNPYISVPSYDAYVLPTSVPVGTPLLPPITDLNLQSAPFTHSSTLPTYVPQTGTNTYESLEFLGDAYLEVIATRMIHARFPTHAVGQKAQLRERLINNETLASYARAYGFDQRVRTTEIQKNQGKGGFTKVLADCFEAYVAAVILSHPTNGFLMAERWLTELWAPNVQDWINTTGRVATAQSSHPEAKKDLENLVMNSRAAKIEYLEEKPMEMDKKTNRQQFFIGAYLTGYGYEKVRLGSGVGRSKAIGGLEAAKDALMNNRKLVEEINKKKLEFERLNPPKHKKKENKHNQKVKKEEGERLPKPPPGVKGLSGSVL